jgi:hypothetical protein
MNSFLFQVFKVKRKFKNPKASRNKTSTSYPALNGRHAICGQRTRFVRADRGRIAHSFACVQVTHEIVVFGHFL